MDRAEFESSSFGDIVQEADDQFAWFLPTKLVRELALEPATMLALSEADEALGRLAGVGSVLQNADLLMRPYAVKEALASARIEGTQADLAEVFQAEARDQTERRHPDVVTVRQYLRSLEQGLARVKDGAPLDFALLCDTQKALVGANGPEVGQLRTHPVWLGSPTDRPENAVFVPPMPAVIPELLQDWEDYLAQPPVIPPLVRAAILHYQLLTIHPFLDGNGRAGRLFVLLFLAAENRLPVPLLYLSPFFERRRREYYDRLQAVRQRGEVQEWIQFFLTAVKAQANDGVDRAGRLLQLRERYRAELAGSRNRSAEVVELIFKNPLITASAVRDSLGMSTQGSLNLLRSLQARGWLLKVQSVGRGGAGVWMAPEIFRAIEEDNVQWSTA